MMSNIFLSYRRDDSADVTGRLYDRLVRKYPTETIFRDVDAIPLGVDFRTHLHEAVSNCGVLLAIIGRQWLSVADHSGRRRIDDERDFVRIEIEAALLRIIPVIPILVQNAVMPSESQLPSSLQSLAFRNGIAVRPDPDFHRDVDRLIQQLDRMIKLSSSTSAIRVESLRPRPAQTELRHLLDTAPRFFICNSNRRYDPGIEGVMRQRQFAAVWESFKWPSHMERVSQGDAIFMWAKQVGIVGVGRANGKHEVLAGGAPGRIRSSSEYPEREWRIPVEWLFWVERDSDAYQCTMPNASFVDASGEAYRELREGVRKRFLGDS